MDQGEIGMILSADAIGHGYATEVDEAILGVAFDKLGLHRVIGRADESNIASRKGMERLGMRLEGHFIEDARRGGDRVSTVLYALLQHEWRAGRRGV
jgi:RimJ/RimL family protein N-acetyltransferase